MYIKFVSRILRIDPHIHRVRHLKCYKLLFLKVCVESKYVQIKVMWHRGRHKMISLIWLWVTLSRSGHGHFKFFKCVTVLPFARMRKRELEELVGLPGFAGRVNRRGFVDLTWQVFIYRSIYCSLTMRGHRWFIYMQRFMGRTDGINTGLEW